MAKNDSVKVIRGKSKLATGVHIFAITLAIMLFINMIYSFTPLFAILMAEKKWNAICYLFAACLIIPAYWSSVTYRMILLSMFPFSSKFRSQTFKVLDDKSLASVPISIVVATRNEPCSIVIPLLELLLKLDYPDYQIVIADNSDIILDNQIINQDLLKIVDFYKKNNKLRTSCVNNVPIKFCLLLLKKNCIAGIMFLHKFHKIQFIRRDCNNFSVEWSEMLPDTLKYSGIRGNIQGGKAGNLNAALESAHEKYKWFLILDSDSLLSDRTLHQMISIGLQAKRPVGFIQSVLSSANTDESLLSSAQSIGDEIYYNNYFRIKAAIGVVSNWGHGVLVSREAWEATGGFPLEISEDLAWANELLLLGKFDNYYALCDTSERKPPTWKALKIQRNRWAKGTTIQMKKQLRALWNSDQLQWHEKMDLTYDMTSYVFTAIGCLLPMFLIFSAVLGLESRIIFFQTLVPTFYIAMTADNLLVPLESIWKARKSNTNTLFKRLKSIPFISIYLGAIASQVLIAVASSFFSKTSSFDITPKKFSNKRDSFWKIILDNKVCYLLFLVNGWVTINAWQLNPVIVPLLAISPIAYFLAPLIGTGKR